MEEKELTTTEDAQQLETGRKKSGSLLNDIMDIMETMLVSVLAVLLLFTYLCRPVTVSGSSMKPTLIHNDKLVMIRLFYEPQPGDIVVVHNETGHVLDHNGNVIETGFGLHENIIKRVIAVAGQSVVINELEGHVYIDGVALQEDYIMERTTSDDGAFEYPLIVPEGYVFVMGDNRNHSTDSRNSAVGLVSVKDIIGKAYFCYYPFDKFGFVG